jgi:hypothetical protein
VLGWRPHAGSPFDQLCTETVGRELAETGGGATVATVEVELHVHGRGSVNDLAAAMAEPPRVHAVVAGDVNMAQPD